MSQLTKLWRMAPRKGSPCHFFLPLNRGGSNKANPSSIRVTLTRGRGVGQVTVTGGRRWAFAALTLGDKGQLIAPDFLLGRTVFRGLDHNVWLDSLGLAALSSHWKSASFHRPGVNTSSSVEA